MSCYVDSGAFFFIPTLHARTFKCSKIVSSRGLNVSRALSNRTSILCRCQIFFVCFFEDAEAVFLFVYGSAPWTFKTGPSRKYPNKRTLCVMLSNS